MHRWIGTDKMTKAALILVVSIGIANFSFAKKQTETPFRYRGGSENLPVGCKGMVELGASALNFKCPNGSLSVPYPSIELMQYRPDISRKIREMKINWKVRPGVRPIMRGKKNRYFTIVYKEQGETRGVVLEVAPESMRPYLAEIDVKCGKRVEVMESEEYD